MAVSPALSSSKPGVPDSVGAMFLAALPLGIRGFIWGRVARDPGYSEAVKRMRAAKPGSLPYAMAQVDSRFVLAPEDRRKVLQYLTLAGNKTGFTPDYALKDVMQKLSGSQGGTWSGWEKSAKAQPPQTATKAPAKAAVPPTPTIAMAKPNRRLVADLDWAPSSDQQNEMLLDNRWDQIFPFTRQDYYAALDQPNGTMVRLKGKGTQQSIPLYQAQRQVEAWLGPKIANTARKTPGQWEEDYFNGLGYTPDRSNPNRGKSLSKLALEQYSKMTGIPEDELPYTRKAFEFLEGLAYSPFTTASTIQRALTDPASIPDMVKEFGKSVNVFEPNLSGPDRFERFLNLAFALEGGEKALGDKAGFGKVGDYFKSAEGTRFADSLGVAKDKISGALDKAAKAYRSWRVSGVYEKGLRDNVNAASINSAYGLTWPTKDAPWYKNPEVFAEWALESKENKTSLSIGPIGNSTRASIKKVLNVDVGNAKVVISADQVRHIASRHGSETGGQISVKPEHFRTILEAMKSPDQVVPRLDRNGRQMVTKSGGKEMLFIKRIGHKVHVGVAIFERSGKKPQGEIKLTTLYIHK